jgi:hypothetical protein
MLVDHVEMTVFNKILHLQQSIDNVISGGSRNVFNMPE